MTSLTRGETPFMQLFRMTTRRWMIAVAIIGIMLGAETLRRRRAFALAMAARHRDEHRRWTTTSLYRTERPPWLFLYVKQRIEMEEKWMEAASHPWHTVEPDPPNLRGRLEMFCDFANRPWDR